MGLRLAICHSFQTPTALRPPFSDSQPGTSFGTLRTLTAPNHPFSRLYLGLLEPKRSSPHPTKSNTTKSRLDQERLLTPPPPPIQKNKNHQRNRRAAASKTEDGRSAMAKLALLLSLALAEAYLDLDLEAWRERPSERGGGGGVGGARKGPRNVGGPVKPPKVNPGLSRTLVD